MRSKYTTIAKITPPKITDVIQRKRLFHFFDSARKKPVIWLSAPAGSGKTTLIASYLQSKKLPCLWYQVDEGDNDIATFFYYMSMAGKKAAPRRRSLLPFLTPEYQFGVPAFTLRYFENLYSRLMPPFVLVFDNYQEASLSSGFHEIISSGLSIIPEGIRAVIISRTGQPSAFVSLAAKDKMEFIGWDKIRLNLNETKELMRIREKTRLSDKTIKQPHDVADGWAAGLVLLSEGMKAEDVDLDSLKGLKSSRLFDYFAREIFKKLSEDMQDFLLKTSFLPKITAQTAEKITGNIRSGHILSELSRDNCFTARHALTEPVYQYHPLFREFLLSKAEDMFSKEELIIIRRNVAKILEESGHIEDAADYYCTVCDWEGLAGLIMKNAPVLITQGRSPVIESWLVSIPEELFWSIPYLIYWKGVCRLPFNPSESRGLFEKSFDRFRKEKDVAGTLLSWAGIVESICFAFEDFTACDRWIKEFDELTKEFSGYPSPGIESRVAAAMFTALVMRQPQHPELQRWKEKALASPDRRSKIQTLFHLIFYQIYIGSYQESDETFDSIQKLLRSADVQPIELLTGKMAETLYYVNIGNYDLCLKVVMDGLKIADETGCHLYDFMLTGNGAISALYKRDLPVATALLKKADLYAENLRPWDKAFYHHIKSVEACFSGNLQKASASIDLASEMTNRIGNPMSIVLSFIYNALIKQKLNKYEEAARHFEMVFKILKKINRTQAEYYSLMIKAYTLLEKGMEKPGLDALRKAFAFGKDNGYDYFFYLAWFPQIATYLYAAALENEIEAEYVQKLIKRYNLTPERYIENWPWPVKIYTLGRFSLTLDGKAVSFEGRVYKRLLEMLKVLIALGGRDVDEEQLTDTLYPEADGDAAHNTFSTSLHRLRRLLGDERFILYKGGKISLNPGYCWVDVWSLERILGKIEKLKPHAGKEESANSTSQKVSLMERALPFIKALF